MNKYLKTYIRNRDIALQNKTNIVSYESPYISEETKLAAVQQDGYAIQYIKNPSEQVQLAAVKQNGYAIKDIVDPSEKVQLAAVQQDDNVIDYIKNPTQNVINYVKNK